MRVLLLPHRYPPGGRGGVETWARELAEAVARAGHRAAVLTRDDGPADPTLPPFTVVESREGEVRVFRLRHRHPDGRSFRDAWADDRFGRPIASVLDTFGPDVVHVAHPDGWGVIPFRLAGARGLVTGATLHDYKWICVRGQMIRPPGEPCDRVEEDACVRCVGDQLRRSGARASLARLATPGLLRILRTRDQGRPVGSRSDPGPTGRARWRARQAGLLRSLLDADVVTSPSRFVADRLRAHGVDREIDLVPNGLGRRGDPAARTPIAPPGGALRIGFFGSPLPTKGIAELVAAFRSLPAGAATLDLHGPSPEYLAQPVPGVTAHGPYPVGGAVERMAGVDLVAIPSVWDENHPMVAVEAAIAGRPLVVSDRGGLPELVRPGIDGWVVPAGDREAWGEQLALLAARPSLVRAAAGRMRPARTADDMAENFIESWRVARNRR